MKKIFPAVFILTLFFFHHSHSQNLSAFINVRGEFYVFEDSFTHQVDYLPPLDYKIGGNCVAFTDNKSVFRIYQYGTTHTPINGLVNAYGVSNNLAFIRTPGGAYAWDQGTLHLLTRFPGDYVLCDSLVGFIDAASRDFMVYQNGDISTAVSGISTQPAAAFLTSGPNIIAFKPYEGAFNIFWNGVVYDQPTDYPQFVKAGTDIIAYLDQHDTGLRVFYRGETKTIEPFSPRSYEVGNEVMAYVNRDGIFKIFWKGSVYEIGNYIPSFIRVKDNVVVYGDRVGYSYAFWEGETMKLENFIPSSINIRENTALYYDQSNRLKIFSKGEVYELPMETHLSTRLDYDVVQMELQGKRFRFFSEGKMYQP